MLGGVRVVELAVWVAGPGAGGVLADWGADVVKIEPPEGDPCRSLFMALAGLREPKSPPFDLDNRGKRSVVLDTRDAEARALARKLVTGADVFISNLRPDALAKLGLDWESLEAECPRLVYASITGYGLRGPERSRAAYDVGAFWARSGAEHIMFPTGVEPHGIRGGFGDHVTALSLVSGIMAALYQRERTGRGQRVATSLLRTGLYCVGWDTGIQLRFGTVAPSLPRTEALNPALNQYRSSDERWFWLLGLEADRHWPKLAQAIGQPELVSDPRFSGARERRKNARELVGLLDAVFATRTLAQWAARFDEVDLWWAPVQTQAEVVNDPQVRAMNGIVSVPEADGTSEFLAVATPLEFSSGPVGPQGAPPRLGQHSDAVLAELGLAPAEIQRLRERGALGK
ncbi:MAG TPA: CaiB/BaiF CoA-transferase family protein [Myxococcota bacterium]|nr:CaiB/BaiF CoA-transferase family protein [Myxococcota bacterium]